MDEVTPSVYTLSVHEAALLLARAHPASGHGSHARIGQAVHRRLKRSRGWRTEISVSLSLTSPHATLRLQGRLDALESTREGDHLIECKSTRQTSPPEPTEVERLQLQLYALMRWRKTGTLPVRGVLLYLNPDHDTPMWSTVDVTETTLSRLEQRLSVDILPLFETLSQHRTGLRAHLRHLPFPMPSLRPGQGRAIRHTYRRLSQGRRTLLDAPTGTGKTLAVMYPALRALGRAHGDRVVYLSARRATRQMVQTVLTPIAETTGLRVLALEARERLCAQTRDLPCECDPEDGGLARARREALKQTLWRTEVLVSLANQHHLCPHRFLQHLSHWADVVIGDYHHVFAPRGGLNLKPFGQRTLLLVDEAHNLHERLCEHLACELSLLKGDPWRILPFVRAARRQAADRWHRLDSITERTRLRSVEQLTGWLADWLARWTRPDDLFQDSRPEQAHLNTVLKLLTLLDQPPETLVVQHTRHQLQIRALDARHHLQGVLRQAHASVLFSATLQPVEPWQSTFDIAYKDTLSLPSPFPVGRRCVLTITNINLRQRHRTAQWPALAHLAARLWQHQPGNYLIFAPTRQAASAIYQQLCLHYPSLPAHQPGSAEEDHALMQALADTPDTGLVVTPLAGRWCEGIDLPGRALLGAVVAGTGMPPWDDFHRHRAKWASEQGWDGEAHTFVYPGWARVLQALGRVIRSAEDKGVLVLIDDRYGQPPLRNLVQTRFPDVQNIKTPQQLETLLRHFWAGN